MQIGFSILGEHWRQRRRAVHEAQRAESATTHDPDTLTTTTGARRSYMQARRFSAKAVCRCRCGHLLFQLLLWRQARWLLQLPLPRQGLWQLLMPRPTLMERLSWAPHGAGRAAACRDSHI